MKDRKASILGFDENIFDFPDDEQVKEKQEMFYNIGGKQALMNYYRKLAAKGWVFPALIGSLGLAGWLGTGRGKKTVEKSVAADPFKIRRQQLEEAEKLMDNPGS